MFDEVLYMDDLKVIVICTKCRKMAPYTPPDANNPWGTFHWHQPCPNCGAEEWGAHDTKIDIVTGRWVTP